MKKKNIRKKYYEYVLEHLSPPTKLKSFVKYAGITKEEFYLKYDSLRKVETDIWKNSLKDVLHMLMSTKDYMSYGSRDRGMAFLYSWFEFMDENKKFFRCCDSMKSSHMMYGNNDFKTTLKKFIRKIIMDGKSCNEFKERGFSDKHMESFFTSIFFMNMREWKRCSKKSKKKDSCYMDALIEKSMTFFFDSLAPNLFDTFIDLMKHRRGYK